MKKFRLKKEATPFFKEDLATSIYDYETWTKNLNVDPKALEEVEPAYITFGHQNLNGNGSSLCGWDDSGSHFYFTLKFPSIKYLEHDKFSKGRVTRELMNEIQNCVNNFYENFNEIAEQYHLV